VDCAVFRPAADASEKRAARRLFGVPEDAFVVGCVSAVKKGHKRVDYVIREVKGLVPLGKGFIGEGRGGKDSLVHGRDGTKTPEYSAAFDSFNATNVTNETNNPVAPFLLIAGARTPETDELIALAESLIPGRYTILTDVGRAQMPELYRAMDVFVLGSLFEMMPIALLEALASGLPCVVNRHPVLEWMIGGAETVDLRPETIDPRTKTIDRREENTPLLPLPSGERAGVRVSSTEALAKKVPAGTSEEGAEHRVVAGVPTGDEQRTRLRQTLLQQEESGAPNSGSNVYGLRSGVRSLPAGGLAIDMSKEGALAAALAGLSPEWLERHGRQARERAVAMFSKETVIWQYVEYYGKVMRNG